VLFKVAYPLHQRGPLVVCRECERLGFEHLRLKFEYLPPDYLGVTKSYHRLGYILDRLDHGASTPSPSASGTLLGKAERADPKEARRGASPRAISHRNRGRDHLGMGDGRFRSESATLLASRKFVTTLALIAKFTFWVMSLVMVATAIAQRNPAMPAIASGL
jgi:hypothetical protein